MPALLIKESVNQTVDNMGFKNSLQACFTLHQLNHAHWGWVHDDHTPAGLPEDGIVNWKEAPPPCAPQRTRPRLTMAQAATPLRLRYDSITRIPSPTVLPTTLRATPLLLQRHRARTSFVACLPIDHEPSIVDSTGPISVGGVFLFAQTRWGSTRTVRVTNRLLTDLVANS